MTIAHDSAYAGPAAHRQRRRGSRRLSIVPLAALVVLAVTALSFVGYVLWPRWPAMPAMPDAPSLPVTIGGMVFNVPPAAIRVPMQRKPGAYERIDLVFLWPSLRPPNPARKNLPPRPDAPSPMTDRIFVAIAHARTALAPPERVKTIYPRYVTSEPVHGPASLAVLPFTDASPYAGEDLVYDGANPANFIVRCSRSKGPTPGICLHEQRIGEIDVTVRFLRDWLGDWPAVKSGIARLIASLKPAG